MWLHFVFTPSPQLNHKSLKRRRTLYYAYVSPKHNQKQEASQMNNC